MEWKKTLIIVSHDQQFLDDVCTDVVHLDQKKLNYYKGNYTDWKAQYQIYIRSRMQQYNKQEKRLKELKVRGTKAKAEKAVKEALTRKQEKNRSQKKRQDMMQDNAETAVELIAKPREYEVDFTFPNPPQLNPPVQDGFKNALLRIFMVIFFSGGNSISYFRVSAFFRPFKGHFWVKLR